MDGRTHSSAQSFNEAVPESLMATKFRHTGLGIAFGVVLGTIAGVLAGHIAIWLGIGIAIGIAIGAAFRREEHQCPQCVALQESHRRNNEMNVKQLQN
jgi:hypothetical protein